MKLILASKSPRRQQLLSQMGFTFECIPAVNEEVSIEKLPEKYAEQLALNKAREVFSTHGDCAVLGSDTIVVIDGQILGKPKDFDGQMHMLDILSNRTHLVITGYAIITPQQTISGYEISEVVFNDLSYEQKLAYANSKLGMDKAGGYGIQDGYGLVNSINGSYTNIVGFPTERLMPLLSALDLDK